MPKSQPTPIRNLLLPRGHKLGRYTVLGKLAKGGFGVVYRARRVDGQEVALKEFLPGKLHCRTMPGIWDVVCSGKDESRFKRGLNAFFDEADTLARVHHPAIVPVWDVFRAHHTAYLAMPLERGMPMSVFQRSRPLIDPERAVRLMIRACRGVEHLHDLGCLHLDLKPSNLWVRPDDSVLVMDLGASRWEDSEMQVSHMARTPGYAAPEQHGRFSHKKQDGPPKEGAAGRPRIDVRADVYGLGATLYAVLTGKAPPAAPQRALTDKPWSVQLAGRFPDALLCAIDEALELAPERRIACVADWRAKLSGVLSLCATNNKVFPQSPPWPKPEIQRRDRELLVN